MMMKLSTRAVLPLLCAGILEAQGQTFTDFTPKFGAAGENVYLTGSGFYYTGSTVDPVKYVRFGETLASATITTDGSITAVVPVGASTGFISIRKNGRDWVYPQSGQMFTVIGAGPYISGFSPTTGNAGTRVYIYGAHFTGVTSVKFGTNAATFGMQSPDIELWADAPANVTTGPITVARLGVGTNTTEQLFYVPPTILGFAPTNGRPGTNVVVTGKNLLGATAVYFGAVAASFDPPTNNSTLVARVPVGGATGKLTVVTPASPYQTSSNFFVEPTIYSIAPNFGPVGTAVTVFGSNFTNAPVVRFNGVQAAIVTNVSFNQLSAVVPAGTTTGPISITTTNGSYTNTSYFYLPPVISTFTPNNSAPGSTITITGQNFLDASGVSFNGTPANFYPPTNNTTIHAFVPGNITTGPISVTTPAGTANSGNKLFYGTPVIYGFNPTIGRPGTNVVISGVNFLGTSAVRFNGTSALFTMVNNTTLTATVPEEAQTGPISVVAPAGSSTSAATFTLDYNADLGVTLTDKPDPVVVGSNLLYTVTVTNRGLFASPDSSVSFTLPGNVTLLSASTSLGVVFTNGNPIFASFGSLDVGAGATVSVRVRPTAAVTLSATAQVTGPYVDPNPADNLTTISTKVLPAALLSVQFFPPEQVIVSWPVGLDGYTLQYCPSLGVGDFWSNVVATPEVIGGENVVTELNGPAARFYRLRK